MATDAKPTSPNIAFLRHHDPQLPQLRAAAERSWPVDKITTRLNTCHLGEALPHQVAATFGVNAGGKSSQADVLAILHGHIDRRTVAGLHPALCREGDDAAHWFTASTIQAKEALKLARTAAVGFHRILGKSGGGFKSEPFQEPMGMDHRLATAALESEATLRSTEAAAATHMAAQERDRSEPAEQRAATALNEGRLRKLLAQRKERERLALQARFDMHPGAIRSAAQQAALARFHAVVQALDPATTQIMLDEDETRVQRGAAGRATDSRNLRFSESAGKHLAIPKWTAGSARADYARFGDLTTLAVAEFKKLSTHVCVVERSECSASRQPRPTTPPLSRLPVCPQESSLVGHATLCLVFIGKDRPLDSDQRPFQRLGRLHARWLRMFADHSGRKRECL